MKKVYSFDVFDTAMIRIWATPTDLFWELGSQLQNENLSLASPEAWVKIRVEAEKNTRKASSTGEVTLQTIYDYIATSLNWSASDVDRAIQKEIELELLSLHPVPEIQKKIQAIHKSNEKVIYISDMYLPKEAIELFLQKNQIWGEDDTLYVSSELGINKASGKLFHFCLGKESLLAYQLNHIGDNLHSDVKIPRRLGITSEHFNQTQLNRYESLTYGATHIPLKFRSLIAGISRLTRVQFDEDSSHKEVIWDTSASVIAPVLFGFVFWCLEQAQAKGIKRLYFVARDGQILLRIAEIICANWDYDIDCRYLYGSRQAWHFPAILQIGEVELDWIFDPTYFLSVRSICKRVNLEPQKIKNVLLRHEFSEETWDNNLDNQQRTLLKKVFQESEVSNLIISIADEYREKAIGYFDQEGLFDKIPFGIVDIGWNGRLQRSLSKLLSVANMYPEFGVYGFYFGLSKRLKAHPTDNLLAYFSDVDKPSIRDGICRYRGLFELFVAADHGGTVRFEKYDNKYVPILRSEKNQAALNWGLETQQMAITIWTKNIISSLTKKECNPELFVELSEILLNNFIFHPSTQESTVFGSFMVAEDQNEHIAYKLAPKYRTIDAINLLLFKKDLHQNVWLPAAISLSSFLPKNLLRCAFQGMILKKIVKEVFKKKYLKYTKNKL